MIFLKILKKVYIFVKKNNKRAMCLYYKMGFKKLKLYMLKNSNYLIMIKGNADIGQFNDMQFS